MGEVISLEKPHPLPIDFQLFKRGHAASDKRLRYIDLTAAILGPDGMADRALYRFDGLHPNKQGYARWTAIIKPVLLGDLMHSS